MPKPQAEITEYHQYSVDCACGRVHCGEFPAGVTPYISYGPRLKAYAVGLVEGHFVALERTCEIIGDQYGVTPSDSAVQTWIVKASQQLESVHEANRQAIVGAEVAHFDESGMRVGGKLRWLHVATTDQAVYYTVHPQRGRPAMEDAGILPFFQGQAVHDHWKSYFAFDQCSHALCNAHYLRELQYCADLTGHLWPTALNRLLVEGQQAVEKARLDGHTALAPVVLSDLLARYDQQVAIGLAACPIRTPKPGDKGRVKQSTPTNLLVRLRDHKDQLLRFLTDWRVPFDNNRAERAVRPVKVKLKVIGGFRAMGGSQAFCVLRSIWETDKLKGVNPFETLRLAFGG
jgi:transposase